MSSKISRLCEAIIEAGWLAALIIVPVFFNVYSSRVFEPDKISLLRSIALVMIGAWLIKLFDGGGAAAAPPCRWPRASASGAAISACRAPTRPSPTSSFSS